MQRWSRYLSRGMWVWEYRGRSSSWRSEYLCNNICKSRRQLGKVFVLGYIVVLLLKMKPAWVVSTVLLGWKTGMITTIVSNKHINMLKILKHYKYIEAINKISWMQYFYPGNFHDLDESLWMLWYEHGTIKLCFPIFCTLPSRFLNIKEIVSCP